jgi:hypothetical protein
VGGEAPRPRHPPRQEPVGHQELVDIEQVTPEPDRRASLRDAIKESLRAFGGKAANYSILARTEGVPIPRAFAIPIYFYEQFMTDNGFYARIDAMLADPAFASRPRPPRRSSSASCAPT